MKHTNDSHLVSFINGTYRDTEWGYAGMDVRILTGFDKYILKSSRGVIAMDADLDNLKAFAAANFWNITSVAAPFAK